METLVFTTNIFCFSSPESLPEQEQQLLKSASDAMTRAYAPYSGFHVGAAILFDDNTIIEGNNQENMAYPSGLCAERVAMYYAGANYPGKKIVAIAITAGSKEFATPSPVAPCGACRQAILEYEMNQDSPISILMKGSGSEVYKVKGVRQLLPLFFNESGLKHH